MLAVPVANTDSYKVMQAYPALRKLARLCTAEQVAEAAAAQAGMLGMGPHVGTIVPAAFAFLMR